MSSIKNIIISLVPSNHEGADEGETSSAASSYDTEEGDDEETSDADTESDEEDVDNALVEKLGKMFEAMRNIKDMVKLCDFVEDNKSHLGRDLNPMIKKIVRIHAPLKKLDNMIGLDSAKKGIYKQLVYFLQGLHDGKIDMLHTVIEGSPGVGKTELGKIMSDLYCKMGILKKPKYVVARRSDLIGEYLGQTSIKTQKVIDSALGGVLFIDEAYSLGDSTKRDSYAKECVDTLNQNLSENKKKFMCIIAGYKDSLEDSFFSLNAGLKRRFNFRISIDSYTAEDLKDIFILKVKELGWKIKKPVEKNCPKSFFGSNMKYFPHYGGDVESFLFCVKIMHGINVFEDMKKEKRTLELRDLKTGMDMFVTNKKIPEENKVFQTMYI